jgi:Glycosyl hydrolase family 63 C-terminal domain
VLHFEDGRHVPLKVRSLVGLIPLFAVETLEPDILAKLPNFTRRMMWFLTHHDELRNHIVGQEGEGGPRWLLSLVNGSRLTSVLRYLLDEREFLSPYGVRALSRFHLDHPYVVTVDGAEHRVRYEPAESAGGLFGGNSNWRGPVWFPVNFLIIEALQKFDWFYGARFQAECPSGAGKLLSLWDVATELSRRLTRIFLCDAEGRRPVHGTDVRFRDDPHWKDLVLFYEYFHGDDGRGVGASHQTGWTGLVAKLLQQSGE